MVHYLCKAWSGQVIERRREFNLNSSIQVNRDKSFSNIQFQYPCVLGFDIFIYIYFDNVNLLKFFSCFILKYLFDFIYRIAPKDFLEILTVETDLFRVKFVLSMLEFSKNIYLN